MKKFLKKWFPAPASYTEGRLFSLDLLRGCDMLFLVFLQPLLSTLDRLFKPLGHGLPDCVMGQLTHNWGGFTAYDIIMPMFIFMCGAAIPFALGLTEHSAKAGRTWVVAVNYDSKTSAYPIRVEGKVGRVLNGSYADNKLTVGPNDGCVFELMAN